MMPGHPALPYSRTFTDPPHWVARALSVSVPSHGAHAATLLAGSAAASPPLWKPEDRHRTVTPSSITPAATTNLRASRARQRTGSAAFGRGVAFGRLQQGRAGAHLDRRHGGSRPRWWPLMYFGAMLRITGVPLAAGAGSCPSRMSGSWVLPVPHPL